MNNDTAILDIVDGGATVDVTDEEIDAAIAEAQLLPDEPEALSAVYNADFDMIVIQLDNHERLLIPRERMQGLEDRTLEQLSQIEIFSGVDIAWTLIDVDHYLPYLIEGRYAGKKWQAAREAKLLQHAAA